MVGYETIRSEEYRYGNNFIEIARKKVEQNEFVSISKGFYTQDGQKRYKGGIGFSADDAALRDFLARWVREI